MTYVELLGRWPLLGILQQALGNHVFQDRGERVALGKLRRRFKNDLLQKIEDALWASSLVIVCASRERKLANSQFHD